LDAGSMRCYMLRKVNIEWGAPMRRISPLEIELLLSIADKPRIINKDMHPRHFHELAERGYLKRNSIDPFTVEYTITRLGKAAIAGIPTTSANVRR
jgi:hypothetical protein